MIERQTNEAYIAYAERVNAINDYKKLIKNILDTRGRFNCESYKERHHILPKCLGGTNKKENLIDLYAKEHYEAHRLLSISYPKKHGLVYAWWMMAHGGGSTKERYISSPAEYEEAKIAYSEFLSRNFSGENNPMYGTHMFDGKNNPMYDIHRYGESAPMYGKHHTKEVKEKISKSRIEKYSGDNHPFHGKTGKLHFASIPVLQFTKEGIFVKEWESSGEINRALGLSKSGIVRCYNHQASSCGDFVWIKKEEYMSTEDYIFPRFEEIKNFKNTGKTHPRSKSVVQLDKDGNFIKTWHCISDVERELNICGCGISNCCNHPDKYKTSGGYRWMYEGNYDKG